MANAVLEYLKKKFTPKSTIDKINKITEGYRDEFYAPINNYEWLEKVKERKEERLGKRY